MVLRLSAGYFNSNAYARPIGRIPLVTDPRDPTGKTTVGGALYPADGVGPVGTAFQNTGTSQPKFDARVDQELTNARVTYSGGVAGTSGIIHTATGPFRIQPGSVMAYGRMGYSRGAFKLNVFSNIVDGEAPNLLVPDARTGEPLQLNFKTRERCTMFEAGNVNLLGRRQALSYGGNYRRNNFNITLTPAAEDRNEIARLPPGRNLLQSLPIFDWCARRQIRQYRRPGVLAAPDRHVPAAGWSFAASGV